MSKKKILSIALAVMTAAGTLSACGGKDANDKTILSVGLWPDETKTEELRNMNERKDNFMKENPDIEIIPDTYAFDTKTFTMKAAANQLPNMFVTRAEAAVIIYRAITK